MNAFEFQRRADIVAIGQRHNFNDMATAAVNAGTSVDEFRGAVLARLSNVARVDTAPQLGLSERDVSNFSWIAVMRSKANPSDKALQLAAGHTWDVSNEYRKLPGVKTRATGEESIVIPPEVEAIRRFADPRRRGLTVGTSADGGYLKGTDHMGGLFVDSLRSRLTLEGLGCQVMPNCVGDVAVPVKPGVSTAHWLAENGEADESGTGIFNTLTASPKTVSARLDISRKLLKQSDPAADSIMEGDLADTVAEGFELACLHGTGPGDDQPLGLDGISGITTVAIGATGGAPTLTHLVGLETAVAAGNADAGLMGFLTNAKVRGKLRLTWPNSTGGDTPIWGDGPDGYGRVLGYKAAVSNLVRSDLTKSSGSALSAIYFGNWADCVAFLWGGMEILIDPYTLSTKGALRLVAFKSCDFKVRRVESFARILDASTAA